MFTEQVSVVIIKHIWEVIQNTDFPYLAVKLHVLLVHSAKSPGVS